MARGGSPALWSMTKDELIAYRDKKAAAVIAALNEGKTLRAIYGDGPNDPSKPGKRTPLRVPAIWNGASVKAYGASHPEWYAEVKRLSAINANAQKGNGQKRRTHCAQGHPFNKENTKYENRTLPSGRRMRSRSCKICHSLVNLRQMPTVEQIASIKFEVMENKRTLRSTRILLSLSQSKMTNLLRTEIGSILKPASKLNRYPIKPPKIIVPRVAKPKVAAQILAPYISPRFRDDGNLIALVGRHVSRSLPSDMQDDIISDVVMQLLERVISENQIPEAVKVAVKRSFRLDHNGFGMKSIDEPLRDGRRLVDMIKDSMWA